MSTTRIVLSPKYKPYADELLEVTGIDSLSNLFIIFLTRYGSHLKASWDISQPSVGKGFQDSSRTQSTGGKSVTQSQVEPIPEPEIDPIIERIARFADRF